MFEQAFKNIDDVLWKEAGCTTELDYTEQTSWLLFLKYLDGLEQDKALEAELDGRRAWFVGPLCLSARRAVVLASIRRLGVSVSALLALALLHAAIDSGMESKGTSRKPYEVIRRR